MERLNLSYEKWRDLKEYVEKRFVNTSTEVFLLDLFTQLGIELNITRRK